jgi:hypothetical protein
MHITETFQHRLGWCPNHQMAAASRPKAGVEIYVIIAIGILVIPAAALLIPSYALQDVAVWAFRTDDSGTRQFVARLHAMEDATGRLSFPAAGAATSSLPAGKYWLVIERPARDGSYRFTLDGAWVKGQSLDPPHDIAKFFSVSGPGSLSGKDAYEALMAAYNGGMYETGITTFPAESGITEREYTVDP